MHTLDRRGVGRFDRASLERRSSDQGAIGDAGGDSVHPLGALRVAGCAMSRHERIGEQEDAAGAGHRPSAGSGG